MKPALLPLLVVLLACATTTVTVGCAIARPPVSSAISWQTESLQASDRQALVALAALAGLPNVRTVSKWSHYPDKIQYSDVIVESEISVKGHRRSWLSLTACTVAHPAYCEQPTQGKEMMLAGRWTTSKANISTVERWRVEDGAWHVDVRLGEGVTFKVAAKIVLAIREKTLVNRLPSRESGGLPGICTLEEGIPQINASEIVEIRNTERGEYEVTTSHHFVGDMFYVRLKDGRVELHRCGVWVV